MIKQAYNWIKSKLKQFVFGSLVLAAGAVVAPLALDRTAEKQIIQPLVFNGQTINFTYTDDNTGEDILLYTDTGTYSSWDSAYGYLAAKNISTKDQNIKFQCSHGGDSACSALEEFQPQVPYQIEVPDFGTKEIKCDTGEWTETKNDLGLGGSSILYACEKQILFCDKVEGAICYQDNQIIGSHWETLYEDRWGTVIKSAQVEKFEEIKPIPQKFQTREQFQYWIPAGATKYFRFKLTFKPGTKCEGEDKTSCQFYVNAYGHLGSKGSLDPWYNSSWGCKMPLTLKATQVGTTTAITGFPVALSTTTANLKTVTNGGCVGKDDGTDILITASDETTKLSHEIETYASSTGALNLWFKTSTSTPLSTSTDTTYYIYYGNSGASDQRDVTGVWDSNYKGVYHLPNGTTLTANDSTSNANNSSSITGTANTGQIDGAAAFDGSQRVTLPDIAMTSAVTLSAWIYLGTSTDWERILAKSYTSNAPPYINYGIYINNTSPKKVNGGVSIGYSLKTITANTGLSGSTWYYVTFVYDGTDMRIYLNGLSDATPVSQTGNVDTWGQNTEIGYNSQYPGQHFTGKIDEARISNTARSAAWIKTEYNNQGSPGTFIIWGTQETNTPASTTTPVWYNNGNVYINGNVLIK